MSNFKNIFQGLKHSVLEKIFRRGFVSVEARGLRDKFFVLCKRHAPEKLRINIFQRATQPHIKKFREIRVTDVVVIRRVTRNHDGRQRKFFRRAVTIDFAFSFRGNFLNVFRAKASVLKMQVNLSERKISFKRKFRKEQKFS